MCDECPVCFEAAGSRIVASLPCSHVLCLQCLLRLPVPQTCPLCRSSLVHLMPRRPSSPTTVTLNVSTRTTAESPLDTARTLSERVRVAAHLADAIRHVGAAPRNARSSYAIVPFDDGGAFAHRLHRIVHAPGIGVVPPPDEDDGAAVSAA